MAVSRLLRGYPKGRLQSPPGRWAARFSTTFLENITSCDVVDHTAAESTPESIQKLLLGRGKQKRPFILRNYLSTIWANKCLRNWTSPASLKSHLVAQGLRSGEYIVRCEFGGNYMDKNMSTKSVCLLQLMDYFNHCEARSTAGGIHSQAYLAQFSILNNNYSLLLDDVRPFPLEIIKMIGGDGAITPRAEKDNLYNVNIWFNGVNSTNMTASPCHYDPYHNLLCQVSGEKRVLLLDPEYKDCMYMHEGVQKNTSCINFDVITIYEGESGDDCVDRKKEEEEEIKKHPLLFSNMTRPVRASLAVLRPGDALYIPLRWMHYCRSRGRSMSTNFFFLL